jgi:pimeloyl-ACP methyl ester carboxylesterase
VASFVSYDGTELSYGSLGEGRALVCLPGGPGRANEYLGDLGGLQRGRRLVLLEPRGVGASADPVDPATLRVDQLVADVEAFRAHLGLDEMDLLAHSAGCILATLYAAAHPQRVSRLVLVTPGLAALGVDLDVAATAATLARNAEQPWYAEAHGAWQRILAGDTSLAAYRASRPLFYGRWDAAAQAHATAGISARNTAAREGYFAGLELDAARTRARLAALTAPVLLYGGERDPLVTPAMLRRAAQSLTSATVVVQAGAGHFPWVDDPAGFAAEIESFHATSDPPVR